EGNHAARGGCAEGGQRERERAFACTLERVERKLLRMVLPHRRTDRSGAGQRDGRAAPSQRGSVIASTLIRVPRVSGSVQTQTPVRMAKSAPIEIPAPRPRSVPVDAATHVMTIGVKNCAPRARLKAAPIAVLRTRVGKSSEKIGPYPEKFPVPI